MCTTDIKSFIKEKTPDILKGIHNNFDENELAFLSLQGKIELQVRDKFAWELQKLLNTEYGKYKYLVRKEWSIDGRKKVDIAILELKPGLENKGKTYVWGKVIALMEFKSHNCLHDTKGQINEYTNKAFKADVSKMKVMARNETSIYYIHLQMCRSKKKGEYIYPDAVSYNTADAITIGDKNGVEKAVENFIDGFRESISKAISGAKILNEQDFNDVDKVFKYVGEAFECKIYLSPIIIYLG